MLSKLILYNAIMNVKQDWRMIVAKFKVWILFVSRVDVVPSAQIIDLCLKIDFASKIDDTWSDTREIPNPWRENLMK